MIIINCFYQLMWDNSIRYQIEQVHVEPHLPALLSLILRPTIRRISKFYWAFLIKLCIFVLTKTRNMHGRSIVENFDAEVSC